MRNIHLLIIDPQNDFCDPNGSLYVDGAEKDMDRVALMIHKNKKKISDIHVTLDSHHPFDVAHPVYWADANGKPPSPFTVITLNDLLTGVWNVSVPSLFNRTKAYLEALEASGKYNLMVWPPHCLISSEGGNTYKSVLESVHDWESMPGSIADMVSKGSNPFTEHYSAVQAEVPDPNDPTTQLNTPLINALLSADEVGICGEALSHCLASTVRDTLNSFGDDSLARKLVILEDATSPVPIAKDLADAFMKEMIARGVRRSTTVDFFA